MRYKINKNLRTIVKDNKKTLIESDKNLKWPIKNVLYNNISISKDLLNEICNILKIDIKTLNLSEIKFHKEKNFGDSIKPAEVKFNGINGDFAEFIGIMLGDGNIYKNSIRIMIDKRERDYREYLKELFYNLFKIRLNEHESKNSNESRLHKDSKNLTNILLKYGLKRGNKLKNNVKVPKWILKDNEFTSRCMKGLMDTDGCVYWDKRDKKTYIKFTNTSLGILEGFKHMADILGLKFAKSGKTSICLYKRSEIEKYLKRAGFSNMKHIDKIRHINTGLWGSLD